LRRMVGKSRAQDVTGAIGAICLLALRDWRDF
jgi:hypothetical protein